MGNAQGRAGLVWRGEGEEVSEKSVFIPKEWVREWVKEWTPPDTTIWIAENVCINCVARYSWFQRMMARVLLGWRVERVRK